MKDTKNIQKKILVCLYIIIGLLCLNTIVLICKGNISSSSSSEESTETNTKYDVSMMESVDLDTMLNDVFKRKDVQVVYMGRSTCSHCVAFLPSLQKAQEELGYKTVYLDIEKVDSSSDQFEEFTSKLDKSYTMNVNGEEKTDTYGSFYGYTPAVFLYKDGEMIDGKIGEVDYDELIKWLKENGLGE